ncbi:hypothetical protein TTHERM_00277120 (macronuclear) [Tetrahymena thermophila SB210]|uniref:Uncharacterized protein n=1 Tax=Tetrahymena thermophila (strain SB210) TaxID=312017 RepID=I7LVB8_TETTS|nr:hypothetical protein TTHERM_00277120 [Tetrahymena thermophila SB210]EAR97827.1 hypothetical protein TTHERM_00277120 [Tetrahymena thermophila SB210]|eukprot:XP_001018072.1 hypothetical protein TTHERM_00277120 [Tetrahymena thermophila SB210]
MNYILFLQDRDNKKYLNVLNSVLIWLNEVQVQIDALLLKDEYLIPLLQLNYKRYFESYLMMSKIYLKGKIIIMEKSLLILLPKKDNRELITELGETGQMVGGIN